MCYVLGFLCTPWCSLRTMEGSSTLAAALSPRSCLLSNEQDVTAGCITPITLAGLPHCERLLLSNMRPQADTSLLLQSHGFSLVPAAGVGQERAGTQGSSAVCTAWRQRRCPPVEGPDTSRVSPPCLSSSTPSCIHGTHRGQFPA